MNDDLDDLDRALFALPLETPPPGMRETILNATVYAAAPGSVAFGRWEIGAIGAALALGTWLILLAIMDRTFAGTFAADVYVFVRALGEPSTLAWLAAGASIATLATLWNLPLPLPMRNGRT